MSTSRVWIISLLLFLMIQSWNCQISSELQNLVEDNVIVDCPIWHYYNQENGKYECYKYVDKNDVIKCKDSGITLLQYGHCMTHDGNTTVVAKCQYFQPNGYDTSEAGYIILPSNVSELNEYMCGPLNRRGPLCNECIDGFELSATSVLFTCTNCTHFSLTYGVPLYILIEIIPITLLYLFILIFRVNLTSSPMTGFILYSHSVMYSAIINIDPPVDYIGYRLKYVRVVIILLYGMWNLDFLKYILPPFCLSSHLKQTHVILFGYISVVYPLCLIIITSLCVELHGRNVAPIVKFWRPFHKYLVRLRKEWDVRSDIIDVFATFLLLSCSKLMYQSLFLMYYQDVIKANSESGDVSIAVVAGNDVTSPCGSVQHLVFAIPASFVLCLALLLILLLILHPFKWFRDHCCFSRCGLLNCTSVNIFVEKFHSCYRNGLDGGRDMRSFSGLYFVLRVLSCLYFMTYRFLPEWTYETILFTSAAMLISLVQPYKKMYMNVLNSLLLALLAMLCHLLSTSPDYSAIRDIEVFTICLIPGIVFWLYLVFKLVLKLWKQLLRHCSCVMKLMKMFNVVKHSQRDQLLTHVHPTSTTVTITDVCSYGSIHS